jgi:membrane dipeptidase
MKHRLSCVLLGLFVITPVLAAPAAGTDIDRRVERVLAKTPLIDGHNDLPWEIRDRFKNKLSGLDLKQDTSKIPPPEGAVALMTDIPRMRAGHMGGQFWSVWIPVNTPGPEAVQMTLEQIDLTKQMVNAYPTDLEMAYTAADIRRIHKAGRVASLIGIEGGHQINASLQVLRQMYDAGARYMTLTHSSNTPWADSATDAPKNQGLSAFGREVVKEMNRIGMVIDLSHVSAETMTATLAISAAPVIFSHSSARALCDHPRDVDDEVLKLVAKNGGIVMVNFYNGYVSEQRRLWDAEYAGQQGKFSTPPFGGLYIGQPDRAKAELAKWEKEHPKPPVTLQQVADHFDHIKQVAGVDYIGIGSDFDGITETPTSLEGVDKYPALLAELVRRGWTDAEIAKVAGDNLLRVLAAVEAESARLKRANPTGSVATIAELDGTH